MQTPSRALPGWLVALVLSTEFLACGGGLLACGGGLLACGGASKDGESGKEGEAKTPAAEVEDGKTPDAKDPADVNAPETKVEDAKASADGAVAADGGAAPTTAVADGGSPPPAATSGPADGGETAGGEDTAAETGAAVDVDALLKEIKSKKTKDERAKAAVAEAEAGGAEPAALAKALVARGEALYADPERAKVFFELANEKDPKGPDAAFNLAKQAALVGDVDEAKRWLTVVHERKGKKLLKKIDFDPMWEIVKDDPDVRAMIK